MKKMVYIKELARKLNLKLLNNVDISDRIIKCQDINRPGLQLTGYFKHYDFDRIQIIGFAEYAYLKDLANDRKLKIYYCFLREEVPAVIFCRNLQPDDLLLKIATERNVPVFQVNMVTTRFMSEIIRWLNVKLAPCITIHGCLADIYGVGVFIQGESGIGKSEILLELLKRGHRLIADDVVEIRKVSDETLYGKAPELTRDLMEIRGLGIVDMRSLYGYQIIKESQRIDLVIILEEWNRVRHYDRLGLDEKTAEILGNRIPCYNIPVIPGRNMAVIIEAAAVNSRQRKMGYNSAEEYIEQE